MLRKPIEPDVNPKSPWDGDALHREEHGRLLSRLVQTLQSSYVLSLRGDWGTGKSTFLRRLKAQLGNDGVPALIINAWKTDYLEDPLLSFVGAIEERLAEHEAEHGVLIGKAKKLVPELAQAGAKLSPSVASFLAMLLPPEATIGVQASAEVVASVGGALLERQKEQRSAEAVFKEKLEEIRDVLTNRDKTRRIVNSIAIIIDELDRCRPDYAVKTLERIKHFFDVPGIVFILATDGTNLPLAVSSVYGGTEKQAERYLRKFVDFEYELPPPSTAAFAEVLFDDYEMNDLVGQLDREELRRARENSYSTPGSYQGIIRAHPRETDIAEVMEAFPVVAKHLKLSLRDQAQALNMANAYLRTLKSNAVCFPQVLVLLCCLRFADSDLYREIKSGVTKIGALNTQKTLANGASLKWISQKTEIGADVAVFIGVHSVRSNDMAAHIKQQAANNGLDEKLGGAYRRLQNRVGSSAAKQIIGYEKKALGLADAFSGGSAEDDDDEDL